MTRDLDFQRVFVLTDGKDDCKVHEIPHSG